MFFLNDKVVLVPGSLEGKLQGILFETRACYHYYAEREVFPIENPRKQIFEIAQDEIANIERATGEYLSVFNDLFSKTFETITLASTFNLYEDYLSAEIEFDYNNIFGFSILISEAVRIDKNWNWYLNKRYGLFNAYYVPVLVENDTEKVYEILNRVIPYVMTKESLSSLRNGVKNNFLLSGVDIERYPKLVKP